MSVFRQSIDLYAQLEPPPTRPMTLLYMSAGWGAIILAYFGVAVYLENEKSGLQAQISQEKQRNQQLEREVDQRKRLDERIELAPLESRLVALRQERQGQLLVIQYLEEMDQEASHSFSDAMAGLARQHVPGIAIEKFSLQGSGGQVSIRGQLGSADALPRYVKNLSHERSFQKLRFDKVLVSTEDDQLSFEMSSQVSTESGP